MTVAGGEGASDSILSDIKFDVSFIKIYDVNMNQLPSADSRPAAIGAQISLRRSQRGLSGAELARRAGISKTTLSNLEAGAGNPTVATLDALAVALRIPMTDLLATDAGSGPVLVAGTVGDPAEITRELLRRISGGHSLEMWRVRIPANETSNGLPHATGTIEHLFVACGHVTAGPADNPQRLSRGDFLAFAGDAPHVYRTDDEPVDLVVTFAAPIPL